MSYGQYQTYVPPLSPINKIILIVTGVSLLIQAFCEGFLKIPLSMYVGLSGEGILSGYVYQIALYPLVHSGLLSYLFSALIIWFIGSDLERDLGQKNYIAFLCATVFGASLIYLAVIFLFFGDSVLFARPPLVGISGLCFSLLIVYGQTHGDRILNFMLIFPMKAKYFCWLLIGIELYMGFFSNHSKSSWGHLGGMGCAYLYFKYRHRVKLNFGGGSRNGPKSKRTGKKKNHLRLVDSDDDDDKSQGGSKYLH
ncbi:rhomboid family intramembrane serine protease [Bacteriovoracaceae bacterium]|nr:rhomboid family intramembrane serine protease [Bacteriovoracaceae bacterium]